MSVDASSSEEAEKSVSELLTAFIQSHPELTSHFGAKAIQGQAIGGDGQPLASQYWIRQVEYLLLCAPS